MFRKLALLCVFLTLCVTVLGAYVRISDAGLGCPQWPGCPGTTIIEDSPKPLSQFSEVSAPTNLDGLKMAGRYLAGVLGVLVLGLFALSFRVQER